MRVTTVFDRCRLVFSICVRRFQCFSIFPKKVIGPDASEKHFGSSGEVWELEFFDFSDDRCTKSSFGKKTGLIFSNFPKKCLGTGASEKLFGPSRGVRRGSGSRLRGSWGSPGGSGGRLGRVLGALGAILERPLRQSDFGSIF